MRAAPPYRALALLCCLALSSLVGTAATAQQAAPTIVAVSVNGCANFGDRISVRGSGFGRAGGRALVLRDANAAVELPVTRWTDSAILATVPKHRQLLAGQSYVLGIQETRTGKWLSGRGRPLQICAAEAVPLGGAGRVAVVPPPPPAPRDPNARQPEPPRLAPQVERPQPLAPLGPAAAPPVPAPPAPLRPAAQAANPDQEPDEVLAIAASLAEATSLAQQAGGLGYAVRSLQELPSLGFAIIRLGLPNGVDVPAALAALRQAFPGTLFDANTLYEPDASSSAAGEPRRYAKALIGWPEDAPGCAAGVDIGLIDTPVDTGHPALAGREILAKIFTAAGVPPAPPDHGTAVAALLVGAPESDASGLLPAARLHAAAIFSSRGDRVVGTTEAIARSLDWLGQEGVRVVNLSLSGPGNQVMQLSVERAHAAGMLLVAAAGNKGPDSPPVFPAGYPSVMAVTAVNAALRPYSHANRGDYIDLAAPGVDVWSAREGNGGRYNTGTSFAAPFVSAAAAVLLAEAPDAAPDSIRAGLLEGARDLGAPGRDATFGWGLLQRPGGC